MKKKPTQPEYDFTLVIDGIPELTDSVTDKLFEAGCDDATFSIQYGRFCAEFSRQADSLEDAILSAIRDIRKAGIGAVVARVDECNLVTQSEIARRIGRTRQLVCQYIKGTRGPGHFPSPECYLSTDAPLWRWCAVAYWLAQNDIIRPEQGWNAQVVSAINAMLEIEQHCKDQPDLVREIRSVLNGEPCPA